MGNTCGTTCCNKDKQEDGEVDTDNKPAFRDRFAKVESKENISLNTLQRSELKSQALIETEKQTSK